VKNGSFVWFPLPSIGVLGGGELLNIYLCLPGKGREAVQHIHTNIKEDRRGESNKGPKAREMARTFFWPA
jgi:hypothetical protein